MTRERSLEILGLEEGFTEAELKKAYRSLAKKYHPDNYLDGKIREEMQEKMKEVNAAYDYFARLYKITGTYIDIDAYREMTLNKMKAYYQNATVGDCDLINRVKMAVNEYARLINFRDGKAGLDNVFEQFLTKLKKVYISYRDKFYENNYIDGSAVKEKIDFNVNVEEFYRLLLRIKDKYSKAVIFEKRVQEEIEPYKMYVTCTSHLWTLISIACVHNATLKAENNGYNNMDQAIASLHEEIKDLFSLVDDINAGFREAQKELEKVEDKSLKEEYKNLEASYEQGAALSDIQRGLKTLREKIEKYKIEQARLAKLKENEGIVNGLYQILLTKLNDVMQNFSPVNQEDAITERLKLMQVIVELFGKYRKGQIELDNLLMLDMITFADLDNDRKVIQAVEGRDEGTRSNSNIYLKKKGNLIFDDTSFFELSEDNGEYVITRIRVNGDSKIITLEDLNDDYISLEEVIEEASYVGATAKWWGVNRVFVLYETNVGNDKCFITLKDGKFEIYRASSLSEFSFVDMDIIERYKDKNLLVEEIELQVKKVKRQEKMRNRKMK